MVDFDKIAKTLAKELKPKTESADSAMIQYACIPVIIKALKLYHKELLKDSSNS